MKFILPETFLSYYMYMNPGGKTVELDFKGQYTVYYRKYLYSILLRLGRTKLISLNADFGRTSYVITTISETLKYGLVRETLAYREIYDLNFKFESNLDFSTYWTLNLTQGGFLNPFCIKLLDLAVGDFHMRVYDYVDGQEEDSDCLDSYMFCLRCFVDITFKEKKDSDDITDKEGFCVAQESFFERYPNL